ncbi:DUF2214 family protein [Gayadomonas joobiniege]|uniref:DUF2214 family protein n=1 Tax=Gayadomonas joobiniege TaxID=1234606 RepID=UPI000381DA7E|nr:DUF2214 family protein [Gayadomonas joobiniege]
MTSELVVRYFHFLGIFFLVSAMVAQHLLIEAEMSKKQFIKLVRIDAMYGISALIVFLTGMTLWHAVGKPAEFYTGNFLFHIKFTLFIVAAVLSLPATVFYLKNRNFSGSHIQIPKKYLMFLRVQKLIILIIPALAVCMARGVGLN